MKAFVPVLSCQMPLCPHPIPTPPSPTKIPFIFQGLVQRPPFPRKPFFKLDFSSFPPPPPTHSGPKYGLFTSESPVLKPSFYMCVLVSSPLDNNTLYLISLLCIPCGNQHKLLSLRDDQYNVLSE